MRRRSSRNGLETLLDSLGVRQKNSRSNHPTTCGKVERFQQTMKKWLRGQPAATTVAELQHQLDTFVEIYKTSGPTTPSTTLWLRDATTLDPIAEWSVTPHELLLQFSIDGTHLGLGSSNGSGAIFDIAAVLDGTPIDGAVSVHDEMTETSLHRLIPHEDRLITSSGGQAITIFDATSGEVTDEIETRAPGVAEAFVSGDGTALYYGDADGVLRRMPLDHDELVELALSRVQRGFTDDECDRYFADRDCPDFAPVAQP